MTGGGFPRHAEPFIRLDKAILWGTAVNTLARMIVIALLGALVVENAGAQADLSGVWQLDTTRSVGLDRAFQLHAQDDGLRSRGSLPGGQPAPSGYAPGAGAATTDLAATRPVSPEEAASLARPLTYGADVFELVQSDNVVVFHPLNLAHDNVSITTDGKKRDAYFGLDGEEGQEKAEWKGERLKVERKVNNMQVVEVWQLTEDSEILVLEVEIKGHVLNKKLEYRRVYQRRP